MNIKQIKELHAAMTVHGYTELNLELKGQSSVKLVLDNSCAPIVNTKSQVKDECSSDAFVSTQIEVRSDKVGTFTFKDQEVKCGDKISKGEIIGVVDGISFKEAIKCSVDGVISSVNITEGAVVDYGRLLFIVDI